MSQGEPNSYLQIKNLWKAFGEFIALEDISLDINEGELVCFLGPSGCGKTTLLRAIAGLDFQSRGFIYQEGQDVSNLPPSQRDFGIVFQSYALFPNLTIRKNIAFGLENIGRSRPDINNRVEELLSLVGLPEQGDKYPAQLSGGQQQRIALARAIASSPGLLLLDEPLSALDAKVRVRLRHEIKSLQRELGITTIMVTHDQEEALAMADRIVVINEGRIEQVGTPTQVYQEPQSLFVADFIGEMNQFAAVTGTGRQVNMQKSEFNCRPHSYPPGTSVVVAIRPDNVVPHEKGYQPSSDADNCFDVSIRDMEFLGSFWRCHLSGENFSPHTLIADFSANAVRRLSLESEPNIVVELPPDAMMLFESKLVEPVETPSS